MALAKRALALQASPPSVKAARDWVRQVFHEIGRDDLVETAELGVTELVTNAILHSRPPLSVRVRGTLDHPRIEVQDDSPIPPQPVRVLHGDEDPTTVGRGLAIVARMSTQWGTDVDLDGHSKTVWFEPAGDLVDVDEGRYAVFAHPTTGPETEEDRSGFVRIELRDLPATLFAELRRHHVEIRRELRLLALSAPSRYPLAVRFTEITERVDAERRATAGVDRLDAAIAAATTSLDVTYDVPGTAPETMRAIRDLFTEIYLTFGEDRLLAIVPPQPLIDLQEWYFTEFVRQGAGEPPIPWTGATSRDG